MNVDNDKLKDIKKSLLRIETRMVRGFEKMGISVMDVTDWFTVDLEEKCIYITALSKTIKGLQLAMRDCGCEPNTPYTVYFNGGIIGTVQYE
jgi:hypothetical protein